MRENLIIILILIIVYQNANSCLEFFTTTRIISKDGNTYTVAGIYADKEEAANKIAELNSFATELISRLKKYQNSSDQSPEYVKGREIYNLLVKRFNPDSVAENDPKGPNETSYTRNKGEFIALCLREKETGQNKLHDIKTLKFVFLHELAHIITPEYEHSDNYWNNFKFLLEFCKNENIYISPNYSKNNIVYCGLKVKYNPLYDPKRTLSFFR